MYIDNIVSVISQMTSGAKAHNNIVLFADVPISQEHWPPHLISVYAEHQLSQIPECDEGSEAVHCEVLAEIF